MFSNNSNPFDCRLRMIGLFMVSQSGLIAQGLMELISHTAPGIPVMAVGGNP